MSTTLPAGGLSFRPSSPSSSTRHQAKMITACTRPQTQEIIALISAESESAVCEHFSSKGTHGSLLRRTKQHIIAPLLVPHRASEQLSLYGLEFAELRFRRPAGRRPRGPGVWYYQKPGEKLNGRRRHGDEPITMDTVCRLPCTAITKIHLVF